MTPDAARRPEAADAGQAARPSACIGVRDLTMAFGGFVVQRDLTFDVAREEILVIMGGSGCGKSTLLRHMIGLLPPAEGDILYDGVSFWAEGDPATRRRISQRFGVLFQSGALFSSMTLAENVALPLQQYSVLKPAEISEIVRFKLALVGLAGFEEYLPAEISGGMRKRAGLARAIAMDPDLLFLDEPSAGLDPPTARRLDELILELRDSMRATVVVVTHELDSIFTIADDSVFLDAESRTMIAQGAPRDLVHNAESAKVRNFLRRGETRPGADATDAPS
ncbi:ABC transporter ATP-binding protein [Rhodovibrio salinarum]|uniref:Polyamine ABC transporter ATP-binding protein n=1 Tax=Rhodovibrio salinarum TaxID=1087 RepID=A0A934QKX4_9PROT|nr:ATP-binding cassette domain-containing protein [Rhodovibrio salinarum]MBK1698811.1 polyamine ABC transporter ATP-binding protein [Rhodovibrio salinarum]